MSMWTAIVIIVIAALAGQAYRHHTKARGTGSLNNDALDELNRRMNSLEKELRDRVETLERIVTDDKADLKRQFDHLDKAG